MLEAHLVLTFGEITAVLRIFRTSALSLTLDYVLGMCLAFICSYGQNEVTNHPELVP